MLDQLDLQEKDQTSTHKENPQGIAPILKGLARIAITRTRTYNPEEVGGLARTERFRRNIEKVQIIAHKAGGGEMPEGTLVAMEKALKNGADWLDVDLRMSEDNILVISHSPTAEDVDESSKVKGDISELNLAEIKKLDAGHNFTNNEHDFPYRGQGITVPTLDEALTAFPQSRFTIHLLGQNKDIEEELVKVIEKYNAFDRVFVAGFSEGPLIKVKELSGGRIKRGAGAKETIGFMDAVKRGEMPSSVDFDFFVPGGEEAQSAGKMYEKLGAKLMDIARQKKLPDIDFIVTCKSLGIPIYIWTVNDKEEMMLWIALGVDGIYTDYPSQLNEIKMQYPEKPFDFIENFGEYLVDGLADWVITYAAANNLGWENRMPTADEIVAEVKNMEFNSTKRADGVIRIERQLQDIADKVLQENAPELDPRFEEVLILATNKL